MMLDFRKPENRREALIRYAVWQDRNLDVDTALPLINYLFDRQEYNVEQRYYMCFLYGQTYQAATAYAVFNEIPDWENIDEVMIRRFNNSSVKKLKYQTDTKWNRGHLDSITLSYLKLLNGKTQLQFFSEICQFNDPRQNYEALKSVLTNGIYKMGRYCVWFYMQSLKECCRLNLEPTSMQYGPKTQSSTDGLCFALGREDLSSRIYLEDGTKKLKQEVSYFPELLNKFDLETNSILQEIKLRFPDVSIDYFKFETILCSFKKLFRRREGRYLGYYLDRLLEDVRKVESEFPGVDFEIVRDFYREKVPNGAQFINSRINKNRMNEFLDSGTLKEFNSYKDLQNL